VLNDIALIQIVEKKPKNSGEFAIVAGGALTAVAKAHIAEVIEIIKEHSAGVGAAATGSSGGVKVHEAQTPNGLKGVSGGYMLEVRVTISCVTYNHVCV
jgi:hypothetical protein